MNDDAAPARPLLRRVARALTLLMVLMAFGLSAMTLTATGVKYDQPGGSFLQKMHPATWTAALALAANILWRPDRFAYLAGLPVRFPGMAYFAAMWAMMVLFASVVQHAPVTPLIDTFFCAVAFLVLYTDADAPLRRTIRIALHALLFVNACVGIGEFLTHSRLTPFVTGGKAILHDYRSTAILGHPLINAAVSAAYALMLFFGGDRSIGWPLRVALVLVQAAALVTFGGRTAIVLCVALAALGTIRPAAEVLGGRRYDMRIAVLLALTAPLLATAIILAVDSGRLDAFIERFSDDKGSTEARVVMFQLFDYFSIEEILLGPDPERLATLQNTLGIEYGIENSWLGFLFQYGALESIFFITGFLALVWELWRRARSSATLLIVFLLIQVSSAAGISVKSFMFNQFAIMLLAIFGRARADEVVAPQGSLAQAFVPRRA